MVTSAPVSRMSLSRPRGDVHFRLAASRAFGAAANYIGAFPGRSSGVGRVRPGPLSVYYDPREKRYLLPGAVVIPREDLTGAPVP